MSSIQNNPILDFAKYTLVGAASGLGPAAIGYGLIRAIRESSRDIAERHSFFQSRHPVGNTVNQKV